MANPTTAVPRYTVPWGDEKRTWGLAATVQTYYPNEMIGVNEAGYVTKFDDTAALTFVGLNAESARKDVETGDAAGDNKLIVERPWLYSMLIASAAIADIGKKVYSRFSNEVQYSDGTYGNYAGKVFAYLSATEVLIAPPWSPFHDVFSSWGSVQSAAATGTTTLTKSSGNRIILLPVTAAKTVVLPPVADMSPGDRIRFIKTTTDLVTVTLDGNASETINGATTLALSQSQYSVTEVYTDGAEWFVEGSAATSGATGTIPVTIMYGELTPPTDLVGFVAGRKYRVRSIIGRPLVAGSDGGAVTIVVKKAPSATAIASGTALHSSSMDAKGTANTNQTLTLSTTATDLEIASGDAIGLDFTGTTTAARGIVTVLLEPVP